MNRFLKRLLTIFGILFGLIILTVVFIGWRLHYAPLDITFLQDFIRKKVPELSFNHLSLAWPSFYESPQVVLQDVTLTIPHISATAPKVIFDIQLFPLLLGRIHTDHVAFYTPTLNILLSAPAAQSPQRVFNKEEVSNLIQAFQEALAKTVSMAPHIILYDGMLALTQQTKSPPFSLEKATFHLLLDKKTIKASTTGVLRVKKENIPIQISLTFDQHIIQSECTFSQLIPRNLTPLLPDKFGFLTHYLHPLSGNIKLKLHLTDPAYKATLDGDFRYALPPYPGQPPIELSVKSELMWQPTFLSHSTTAKASSFPTYILPELWAPGLSDVTRDWFLPHITQGRATRGDATFSGKHYFNPPHTRDGGVTVSGHVSMQGSTLEYLEGMPKVTDIDVNAHFDNSSFIIHVDRGHTNNIQVTGGTISFLHLDKPDQQAQVDLKITSPLAEALWLLNHPPLNFAKDHGLNTESFKGDVTTTLQLEFPLSTTLTPSQLTAKAQASLRNVSFVFPILDTKAIFSEGNLHLSLDKEGLKLSGPILLEKNPATIEWEERFHSSSTYAQKYLLDATLPLSLIQKLNFPYLQEISTGKTHLTLTALIRDNRQTHMTIVADLLNTDIRVPVLDFFKPSGQPGRIQTSLHIDNGQLRKLSNFIYEGGTEKVQSDAVFSHGLLQKLTLHSFQLGKNNFSGSWEVDKTQGWHLHAKGLSLNLAPILQQTQAQMTDTNQWDLPSSFSLTAKIDHVLLTHNISLDHFNISAKRSNGYWRYITAEAKYGQTDKLSCSYGPDKEQQKLNVSLTNLGALLRGFDVIESIYGGKVLIKGSYPLSAPLSPLMGTLSVEKMRTKDAPVLAQLLNLASISGITAILRGKGIVFDEAHGEFSVQNGVITLDDGYMSNSSLGLTAEGVINLQTGTLHLIGSVIPANVLNQIIGHIPLIGTLLSGGNPRNGVFSGSYELKGPLSHPEISMNPLSVLAPNLIKGIFRKKRPSQENTVVAPVVPAA